MKRYTAIPATAFADTIFLSEKILLPDRAVQVNEMMLDKKDIDPQIRQLAKDMAASRHRETDPLEGWLQT